MHFTAKILFYSVRKCHKIHEGILHPLVYYANLKAHFQRVFDFSKIVKNTIHFCSNEALFEFGVSATKRLFNKD